MVGAEQLLPRLEGSDQVLFSREGFSQSSETQLRVMWEANCSCRAAGYPESSMGMIKTAWGDGSACSWLPSPIDVPTMSQTAARESVAALLRSFRKVAALVWPNHTAAADAEAAGMVGGGHSCSVVAYADWEVLQAELLESAPGALPALCGEGLWCFNPACTNLEGPSELALKTHVCGGGCGVRYCSPECQARGWRDGHRLSCERLRDRSVARLGGSSQQ